MRNRIMMTTATAIQMSTLMPGGLGPVEVDEVEAVEVEVVDEVEVPEVSETDIQYA
jgi:hypothetical protein